MTMMTRPTIGTVLLVTATLLIAGTEGFVAPSTNAAISVGSGRIGTTRLYSDDVTSTGWDSFRTMKDRPIKDISYGEDSRKFRRTVYTHDDWKKHRSPDRFLYYLTAIFKSGVYKNLGREVTATTVVAMFVCLYNAVVGGYEDFEGVKHAALISTSLLPKLGLPLAPFTLASPSLGLLLGMLLYLLSVVFGGSFSSMVYILPRRSSLQCSVQTHHTNVGMKPVKTGVRTSTGKLRWKGGPSGVLPKRPFSHRTLIYTCYSEPATSSAWRTRTTIAREFLRRSANRI